MRAELQMLHANIETVGNARRTWSTRSSVRLILDDGAGHVGLGEAAPLAGFSSESPVQARAALEAVEWPRKPPESLDEIAAIVERIDPALPSARFAAETALASMLASRRGRPLWALYTDETPEELPIAQNLWGESLESLHASAAEAAAYELQVVKLKVGRAREEDRARLDLVRELLPNAELRLDANGSFAPDALEERVAELSAYAPSFLEEPMPLDAVLATRVRPAFPFAVDESLAPDPEARLSRALEHDAIGVVVLKPTLLGGLARCRELARRARQAGRAVVISHLLEGAIARAAAAHLALALGGEAAGLGDHPALDPLSDGLSASWIDLAWIVPPDVPGLGLELVW